MLRRMSLEAGLVAMVCMPGCSLLVDADEVQCNVAADCAERGFGSAECVDSFCVAAELADPRFGCRDSDWPEMSAEETELDLIVQTLVGQTPYGGLTLQVCPLRDAACEQPIGSVTTEADGRARVVVPFGFRGHFFAPPPADNPTLAPRILHIFPPPGSRPSDDPESLLVTTLAEVTGLVQLAGGSLVEGTGHFFFTVADCQGQPLESASVSSSVVTPDVFITYVGATGLPDPGLSGTSTIGQGALLNLPPGFVTVRAIHEQEGKVFEQAVLVAADTITTATMIVSRTL